MRGGGTPASWPAYASAGSTSNGSTSVLPGYGKILQPITHTTPSVTTDDRPEIGSVGPRPGTAIGIGTDERRAGSAPLETPARGPVARWLRSAQPRWWSPGATGAGGGYSGRPARRVPSPIYRYPSPQDSRRRAEAGTVGAWDLGLAAARLNSRFVI